MKKLLNKKTAAAAVLLLVVGTALAASCQKCYCITVAGGKFCWCQSCQNID